MRVLHLASGNRWTGAAAPAFAEAEALRSAGLDAHFAYVGGYKLQEKIGKLDWCHAVIEKAQNPVAFLRSARAIRDLGHFDVLHAHLTYDHVLAAWVAARTETRLARTFHARRVLRQDGFSRRLLDRTDLLLAVNETFAVDGRTIVFTPPPLNHQEFRASGATIREMYRIPNGIPLFCVIGKIAPGRGFELAIESFAAFLRTAPAAVSNASEARLMIIGHGPHEQTLRQLVRRLAIEDRVIWAGYHERHLADHYRSADLLLFTAAGSDEGHRAVLEAMACGVAPVCAPIPGLEALLRELPHRHIAASYTPEAIAAAASALLERPPDRQSVVEHSMNFGYPAAAARLLSAYGGLAPGDAEAPG